MQHSIDVPVPLFARIALGVKTFLTIKDPSVQRGDRVNLFEFDTTPQNATTHVPKGRTGHTPMMFEVGFVEVDRGRVTIALLKLSEPTPPTARKTSKS